MTPEVQQAVDLLSTIDSDIVNLNGQVSQLKVDNDSLTQANSSLQQSLTDTQGLLSAANDKVTALTAAGAAFTSRMLRPGELKIWTGLENLPMAADPNHPTVGTWGQPGNSGNTGGTSTKPHGTLIHTPGSFTEQPAGGYDNFYLFTPLGIYPTATDFSWNGEMTFPTLPDETASQALEWELEQCIAGFAYNMAWQANFSGKTWRTFDLVNQRWVEVPSIPFNQFAPGVPVKVTAEYHADYTAQTLTHVAITINGTRYPVGITRPGKQRWSSGSNYLHYAYQMDTNGKGTPYTVNVSNMAAIAL